MMGPGTGHIVRVLRTSDIGDRDDNDDPIIRATTASAEGRFDLALNVRHPKRHAAADAFWKYWKENGETGTHGYYESTWGAINAALRLIGVRAYKYPTSSGISSDALASRAEPGVPTEPAAPQAKRQTASASGEPVTAAAPEPSVDYALPDEAGEK